ncbi:MAG TPA: class I SAM-dependent methyltransferase [Solirubrobacteraceae bacterium]|jgi:trans-aconitate 2-methyltransferase
MPVREWDGASYDRVSGPQLSLGLEVLDRLQLSGDERVLDAGCGSGRITEALLDRLQSGSVIGVDESASMVNAARRRLGERAELRVADLVELELPEPLDAVLSTATFHWIADHERLFARLHALLRPGGRLVAQCGGHGNVDGLRGRAAQVLARPPYAEHFAGFTAPWNYAGAEVTRERLLAAGFSSAECWLAPAPQCPEHPREFLATVIFEPHLRRLRETLRERFMDELLEHLGEPVIVDYVRLNIDATA